MEKSVFYREGWGSKRSIIDHSRNIKLSKIFVLMELKRVTLTHLVEDDHEPVGTRHGYIRKSARLSMKITPNSALIKMLWSVIKMTKLHRTFDFAILCRVNMTIEHYKFAFMINICFNFQPRPVSSSKIFGQPVINNILEHHFFHFRNVFLT